MKDFFERLKNVNLRGAVAVWQPKPGLTNIRVDGALLRLIAYAITLSSAIVFLSSVPRIFGLIAGAISSDLFFGLSLVSAVLTTLVMITTSVMLLVEGRLIAWFSFVSFMVLIAIGFK